MSDSLPSPHRRRALGLLAGLPLLGRASRASADTSATVPPGASPVPLPGDATMLVPGPNGGTLNRWARLVQPALAQSVGPGTQFHQTEIGGADGVTAANQFEARGAPDGFTLLMVPGETPLAWLVGDPRAKFDVSRWVPVVAAVTPAVVVGRLPALLSGRPMRVAAGSPGGLDLPLLLGIELLGVRAETVPGLVEEDAIQLAFSRNLIDAVLLRGHKVPDQVRGLAATGVVPLFSLGVPDGSGRPIRATEFAEVPFLAELYTSLRGAQLTGPLFAAWSAAAVASELEFGLVLPELTPAPMVALWRRAGVSAMDALEVQSVAASLAVRPLSGASATACGDVLSAGAPALLALRQWLAERFNWRPV